MDFMKELKRCQYERHMTNNAFAKHLGKTRAWLQRIYSTNPDVKKSELSELTMFIINEQLNIPFEMMEEFNKYVISTRNNTQESADI